MGRTAIEIQASVKDKAESRVKRRKQKAVA
jgi:hypothetical protein